jgi:hypothetical protein
MISIKLNNVYEYKDEFVKRLNIKKSQAPVIKKIIYLINSNDWMGVYVECLFRIELLSELKILNYPRQTMAAITYSLSKVDKKQLASTLYDKYITPNTEDLDDDNPDLAFLYEPLNSAKLKGIINKEKDFFNSNNGFTFGTSNLYKICQTTMQNVVSNEVDTILDDDDATGDEPINVEALKQIVWEESTDVINDYVNKVHNGNSAKLSRDSAKFSALQNFVLYVCIDQYWGLSFAEAEVNASLNQCIKAQRGRMNHFN